VLFLEGMQLSDPAPTNTALFFIITVCRMSCVALDDKHHCFSLCVYCVWCSRSSARC